MGNGVIVYRYRDLMTGRMVDALVTREQCWKCDRKNPDLTHHVLEYVAAVISEPLRRAFQDHLDVHGCGTGDHNDPRYIGGFGHCPEAMRLFGLQPEAEQVLVG
jgi:hypothetical protein